MITPPQHEDTWRKALLLAYLVLLILVAGFTWSPVAVQPEPQSTRWGEAQWAMVPSTEQRSADYRARTGTPHRTAPFGKGNDP